MLKVSHHVLMVGIFVLIYMSLHSVAIYLDMIIMYTWTQEERFKVQYLPYFFIPKKKKKQPKDCVFTVPCSIGASSINFLPSTLLLPHPHVISISKGYPVHLPKVLHCQPSLQQLLGWPGLASAMPSTWWLLGLVAESKYTRTADIFGKIRTIVWVYKTIQP